MKIKRISMLFVCIFILLFPARASAFKDTVTHPNMISKALSVVNRQPDLDAYLRQDLGLVKGLETEINSHDEEIIVKDRTKKISG